MWCLLLFAARLMNLLWQISAPGKEMMSQPAASCSRSGDYKKHDPFPLSFNLIHTGFTINLQNNIRDTRTFFVTK